MQTTASIPSSRTREAVVPNSRHLCGISSQPPAQRCRLAHRIAARLPAMFGMLLAVLVGSSTVRGGTLFVPAGQTSTNDLVRTSVVGTNLAGANQLLVLSTNGFATNDWLLVIVMQDIESDMSKTTVGVYEFANISRIQSNSFALSEPLSSTYAASGKTIQVIRVPIYDSVNVQGTITCSPWNGTNGGVLAILSRGDVKLDTNGIVTSDGCGYRGGIGSSTQGESSTGYSTARADSLSHLQGGGGAGGAYGGGGGGAYGGGGRVRHHRVGC